jgi:mono/diheme cytochrome c family protein
MRDTKHKLTGCLLAGFAVALAAPTIALAASAQVDKTAAAKGLIVYGRYCVSCHGVAGAGDGPLAGDLRVPVPDLRVLSSHSGGVFPYDRVVNIINNGEILKGHGTPDMPAWGDAFKNTKGTESPSTAAAITSLTHYLWSLQTASRP